jgi:hypothetical protein
VYASLTYAASNFTISPCVALQGVSGNAAKSGIKAGDTIIYASSFFGDELWPADKLSFTQTAIQRAPSPVCFVYVSGSIAALWICMPEQYYHYAYCNSALLYGSPQKH